MLARLGDEQFDRSAVSELLRRKGGELSVVALVRSPVTREQTLAAIRATPALPVNQMARLLGSSDPATRLAVARMLGAGCHSGSLPVLAKMIDRNQHRREAMMGILSCNEPVADKYLATIRRDPGLASLLNSVQSELQNHSQMEQL
jgi:hypothetical protein